MKRTINDLNHSYTNEGMTARCIQTDDVRFKIKDTAKMFFKHKPYANDIKQVKEDIEARAKGYIILNGSTTPQTVYKKKLDRDDIIDITEVEHLINIVK